MAPGQGGRQVLFVGGFDGLFRSDDRAATWHERQTFDRVHHRVGRLADYARDHTVAVNSYAKGAYLTNNGGTTWRWADNGSASAPTSRPIKRLFGVVFLARLCDTGNHLLRDLGLHDQDDRPR